jgi:hypothetical protein
MTMSVLQENIAVTHPQDHFTFVEADLAVSQDDAPLHRVATSITAKIDAVEATMPWDGSVVGIAYQLAADKTAGVLEFNPSINGVASTFGVAAGDDADHGSAVQAHGRTRFKKGDALGCTYSSDAALLPAASADVMVEVYVVFDGVNV